MKSFFVILFFYTSAFHLSGRRARKDQNLAGIALLIAVVLTIQEVKTYCTRLQLWWYATFGDAPISWGIMVGIGVVLVLVAMLLKLKRHM